MILLCGGLKQETNREHFVSIRKIDLMSMGKQRDYVNSICSILKCIQCKIWIISAGLDLLKLVALCYTEHIMWHGI